MQTPPKSWLDRHKWWAIPSGCLGCGCLGVTVLLVSITTGFVSCVGDAFKHSGSNRSYQLAFALLEKDPKLNDQLGSPLKTSWPWASMREFSDSQGGRVCESFIITGSRKSANVYVEASQPPDGSWELKQLRVTIDGQPSPTFLVSPPPGHPKVFCPPESPTPRSSRLPLQNG